ncbi:MAG: acyl-CoA dehydrogenase family protein, partial [Gemmatimonadota bacterium]
MTTEPERARRDLEAWRACLPPDPYAADGALRSLNRLYLRGERLAALERSATEFGRRVIEVIGPAAARYEGRAHLPELSRYDGLGRRVERIRFDPAYHRAGAAVWGSGIVAHSGSPGRAFEQATLLYLLSLEGEAGHACPAVCSIGLARALRRRASGDVRERFLPALLRADYERAERASQFLTEVQGGSDVGANACRAVPREDGAYRLWGEKWFCSVADAGQFLVTARPEGAPDGTRGLGCFVVPREIGGAPNGFSIRRLKDKLGTRGMASGELDLEGALAWPIGPVEEGFKTAVGIVLNTSRWMTAIGSTGMMRR